jgi:hypothetical protein
MLGGEERRTIGGGKKDAVVRKYVSKNEPGFLLRLFGKQG